MGMRQKNFVMWDGAFDVTQTHLRRLPTLYFPTLNLLSPVSLFTYHLLSPELFVLTRPKGLTLSLWSEFSLSLPSHSGSRLCLTCLDGDVANGLVWGR